MPEGDEGSVFGHFGEVVSVGFLAEGGFNEISIVIFFSKQVSDMEVLMMATYSRL